MHGHRDRSRSWADPHFHEAVKIPTPYSPARPCRRLGPQPVVKWICVSTMFGPILTYERAREQDVGRASVGTPGLVQSGAARVERKVALMTAYGKRLSAWAAGIITTAVLVAPGYTQDKKVRLI